MPQLSESTLSPHRGKNIDALLSPSLRSSGTGEKGNIALAPSCTAIHISEQDTYSLVSAFLIQVTTFLSFPSRLALKWQWNGTLSVVLLVRLGLL